MRGTPFPNTPFGKSCEIHTTEPTPLSFVRYSFQNMWNLMWRYMTDNVWIFKLCFTTVAEHGLSTSINYTFITYAEYNIPKHTIGKSCQTIIYRTTPHIKRSTNPLNSICHSRDPSANAAIGFFTAIYHHSSVLFCRPVARPVPQYTPYHINIIRMSELLLKIDMPNLCHVRRNILLIKPAEI